jgi:hypothetical protein
MCISLCIYIHWNFFIIWHIWTNIIYISSLYWYLQWCIYVYLIVISTFIFPCFNDTLIFKRTDVYIYVYIHISKHFTINSYVYECIYTSIYIHICIFFYFICIPPFILLSRMYIYMYVCNSLCICIRVCVYT